MINKLLFLVLALSLMSCVTTHHVNIPDYSRSAFGSWIDEDSDCQNTRHELLIERSAQPVQFKTSKGCLVTLGEWISPYSNATIHNAKSLDADHVVPLEWAWRKGAWQWSKETRKRFANDPENIELVELGLNRSKGSRGPDEWLPPANQCEYVQHFKRIAVEYGLKSASVSSTDNDC